ncbi:MAG: PKD domain-containing protein [Chitinophagales bacterium]|nr:PKD domain-containing protein [Chitinophagales bacterium]
MKQKILTMVLWLSCLNVFSQTKYYQTNFANLDLNQGQALLQSVNNHYYVANTVLAYTNNEWHSCISEVVLNGNVAASFCDSDQPIRSIIRDITLTNEGAIVGVGFYTDNELSNGTFHSYYYKIDQQNNITQQILNSDLENDANVCINTIDGGILVGGYMTNENTDPISFELHLIKVDSLGVEQWHQTYYNFTKNNTYEDIIALPDGSFYGLATIKDDYWQQANIALLHLSATGIPISIQEYNLGGRDLARCLIPTNDGGLLFSASSYPTNNELDGISYLYKLNANGDTMWTRHDIFQAGAIFGMVQLADSSYVIAGSYYPTGFNYFQGCIVKLDVNGNVLWQRVYGGDRHEYIYDLIINNHNSTGKDGYVMCGRTESTDLGVPLGNANVYFLKTNCMGLLTEPQAQFSYLNPADNIMEFQNLSQYVYPDSLDGGHYLWDFGDGFNTNEQNPTHTYTAAGVYNISLTAVVCNDTSRYTQTICVGSPSFAPLFSYQTNSLTATFINQSTGVVENQGSFIWNFGDGATSVEQNPMHTYTQSGSYTVELQAVVCEDTLIYRQTVVVVAVGIEEASPLPPPKEGVMQLLPNPANTQLTISSVKPLSGTFVLYDVFGKEVARQLVNSTSVKTENLPSGIYLYQIINPQNQILQLGKVSIVH